jgi:hypothetical protein
MPQRASEWKLEKRPVTTKRQKGKGLAKRNKRRNGMIQGKSGFCGLVSSQYLILMR